MLAAPVLLSPLARMHRAVAADPVLRVVAPWTYETPDSLDTGYILTRMGIGETLVTALPGGQMVGGLAVKRRKLYDDVLGCVREIERRGHAVALAGSYQIDTENAAMPMATAALVGFFPKLTDPAAINRQTLFAPARMSWADAWRQFCAEGA